MLKSLIYFFLLSFIPGVHAKSLNRGGAEFLNPKAYAISASASVFTTSAYFDAEGVEQEIGEGNEFSYTDLDLGMAYGLSPRFEVAGLAKMRRVSSTLNTFAAENSGIESLGILGKYGFEPIGKARYALGVYYRQTLYTNTDYATFAAVPFDEVVLGDSGSEYGVNAYLTYIDRPLRWDFLMGYRSPANKLSDEIIFKAQGMYTFTKLSLSLGVEGISSLKNDSYADTPLLKPVQATGASHEWNSINREKMAPYIGAHYSFENFLLGFKAQTITAGQSTDKGTLMMASLDWGSDGITQESVKIGSFKEYQIDGSVLKVSARGNFIKIDQGLSTDVEKGMKFDIYQTDYFGGNVLVGTGVAYDVGSDWSIIKLVKRYNEIVIKPGFAARGY